MQAVFGHFHVSAFPRCVYIAVIVLVIYYLLVVGAKLVFERRFISQIRFLTVGYLHGFGLSVVLRYESDASGFFSKPLIWKGHSHLHGRSRYASGQFPSSLQKFGEFHDVETVT